VELVEEVQARFGVTFKTWTLPRRTSDRFAGMEATWSASGRRRDGEDARRDLREAAGRDPDRPAIAAPDGTLSYAELDRSADLLAAGLRRLGVGRGDRVAVLLPNGADAAVAIYGALRAQAAFSPLNPTVKRDKLAYVLRDVGAAILLTDNGHAELAHEAAEMAGGARVATDLSEVAAEAELALPARWTSISLR
jgi:acyl-CoA synthetase (AMP-forming)/AMP-acid ligase II